MCNCLIEFILIMTILSIWQNSKQTKKIFHVIILLYIIFWIIAKATFEPLNGLYTMIVGISQTIITVCAEITLYNVIGNRIQSIFNLNQFWCLLRLLFITQELF